MNLKIDYHRESDTLWLSNGQPTPNGEDVAENVTVFFDDADRPNGVMIEHAAALLRSILNTAGPPAIPESQPAPSAAD